MMIRSLVLMVSIACSGCLSFAPIEEVRLPADSTPEEVSVFTSAADGWCQAAGVCLEVTVGEPANVEILRDCEVETASTEIGQNGATIRLCEGAVRPAIVLHELGHALAPHREDHLGEGNIMAPSTDKQSGRLTRADVAWVLDKP